MRMECLSDGVGWHLGMFGRRRRIWEKCLGGKRLKKVLAVWFLILLIPYAVTLVWAEEAVGEVQEFTSLGKREVRRQRESGRESMDAEEYLIGVLAAQIPPEYGLEAVKAQAVIARTYLYGIFGERSVIEEEELDLDYMEWKQMLERWGQRGAAKNYSLFQKAVKETEGIGMQYEGQWLDALFHQISAGRTRDGDRELFPYLVGVESRKDSEAEDYLGIFLFSEEDFAAKIREITESGEVAAANIFQSIQIVKKDAAGYVEKLQIAGNLYEGEQVQYALGLPSACFSITQEEGKIRIVTKGVGHGYGLSQYGAKAMADSGWKMEDILQYYYQNITLISE
ncbi:MAG: SpoIID/LytB domain-containing protein [bacterium]|nr:SpoIID/LytB domain-containing protein [bacterium]